MNKELKVKIALRADSSSAWASVNPVLLKGEAGYEVDTGKLKFGDGTTNKNEATDRTGIRMESRQSLTSKRRTGH